MKKLTVQKSETIRTYQNQIQSMREGMTNAFIQISGVFAELKKTLLVARKLTLLFTYLFTYSAKNHLR